MASENTSLSEVASQSAIIISVVIFSQISSFLARIIFKVILPPDQYGLFAFFINMGQFAITLNGFSLHIPLIARISEKREDVDRHIRIMSQIIASSLIIGSTIGVVFFIWTPIVTSNSFLSIFYALSIVIISSGQIAHCYPRGLDTIKPAVTAYLIIGSLRFMLVLLFLWQPIINLEYVCLIYTLPSLGWWIAYLYTFGIPKISKPDFKFVSGIYFDGGVSYLLPLSNQLPQIVGIVLLSLLSDFGAIGDFDIVLIPYSLFSVVLSGVSFVVLNKARKMGNFRDVLRRILKLIVLAVIVVCFGSIFLAITFEGLLVSILGIIGIPTSIYWPAIILVAFGIPPRIIVVTTSSYFQGRGDIKPIGVLGIICTIVILPIEIFLTLWFSVLGLVISLIFVNLLIGFVFITYGLRKKMIAQT